MTPIDLKGLTDEQRRRLMLVGGLMAVAFAVELAAGLLATVAPPTVAPAASTTSTAIVPAVAVWFARHSVFASRSNVLCVTMLIDAPAKSAVIGAGG